MEPNDKDNKNDGSIVHGSRDTDHSEFLQQSHLLQGDQEEISDDDNDIQDDPDHISLIMGEVPSLL